MWSQTLKRLKNAYVQDCRNLIIVFGRYADYSYAIFKNVWADIKFTYILDAKPEDVEDEPFLQELYRIFLGLFLGYFHYFRVCHLFNYSPLRQNSSSFPVNLPMFV